MISEGKLNRTVKHQVAVGNVPNCHSEEVIIVIFMPNRCSKLFTATQIIEMDPCIPFHFP
jgi:hypothetical protein